MKNSGNVYFARKDSLEHYVKECSEVKVWFREMGGEDAEILEQLWEEDLDSCKGKLLRRLIKALCQFLTFKISKFFFFAFFDSLIS